jgi:hypothetical protein
LVGFRRQRHAGERGDPDPGQYRDHPAEQLGLDDVIGLFRGDDLAHERLAGQRANERNQEDPGVAERQ